ncbi:MAG: hypothetical protein C0394_06580 [Syntrophus sp. (in: bacteria)]|nr:hypothetical protein [Syntrophus sp. (in: bacteria)]
MKRIFIFLTGFLLISSLPLLCEAQTKAKAPSPYAKSDLVQLTLVKGDYLINICKQYLDSENRWQEISRINRLRDPHKLQPGTEIALPLAYLKGTPLEGKVTFVQGDAKAQPGGQGAWVSLKTGDMVSQKSNLKTGTESALEITFADGSSFFLRSDTQMGILTAQKVLSSNLMRDLYLGAGRVLTTVKGATGAASRFKIHTPSAIASVRGTEFRVAVDDSQKTYAEVMKSIVTVAAAEKSVELSQGEGTMVEKGAPPLPPRKLLPPPAPADIAAIYNSVPVIRFSVVEGADSYRVMTSRDKEGRQLLREKIIKPRDAITIAGLADGSYYLLTQSIDPLGLEGLPSEAYLLRIRVNPLPPITQMPADGAKFKGAPAIFHWLAVSDAVRYRVQIAEDREFANIVLDKADLKESTFRPGDLAYKNYFFRVSSIARDDYQGAWSDPLAFTLVPLPPTPSVDQPTVSKDEINLKSRNLGEGFTYHFQIAKDKQFKELLLDNKTEKPEITIKKPKDAGTYYVQIAAIDRDGDAGEFSPPQSFEIKERFPYAWLGSGIGAVLLLLLLAH